MIILITGASRSLGLCLAVTAAQRGHTVIAGVRDRSKLDEQAQHMLQHTNIEIVTLNVQDEQSVSACAADISQRYGKLDAVINNAAISLGDQDTIEQVNLDELAQTMDVNLYGPIRVVKHCLPLLRQGTHASILNVSSDRGSMTKVHERSRFYAYSLSKSALNMFSQMIALYVKEADIQVLAVHPGWMRTDMGGPNADLDPMTCAEKLCDLAERTQEVPFRRFAYVTLEGEPMPL